MPKLSSNLGQLLNQNLTGIFYFACGMFLFSAVDAIAKILTDSFHPIQVAWSRQLGLLLGIFIILIFKGVAILQTNHLWLQISRGFLAGISALVLLLQYR